MNNKGFTLIEVMGVLVLLTIIIMVIIPNVTNTLKKTNLEQLEKYEETLCLAAKSYALEENVTISGTIYVNGTTLISKNYLSSSLSNPNTKKNAKNDRVSLKYKANNAIECHLEG